MKRINVLTLVFFVCFVLTAWPQTGPQLVHKVIEFDVTGAGAGANQGTIPQCINAAGEVVGSYVDSNNVAHGFVRFPNGSITTFDPQNSAGTLVWGNNSAGWITGTYADAQGVNHGFLRDPQGNFTIFNAPDAGAGQGQGTYGYSISPAREVVGGYTDSNGVGHSLVRSPEGKITDFDPHGPGIGAVTDSLTIPCHGITPAGTVGGAYHDPQGFVHAFVRAPDGTFTTFSVPGNIGIYPACINEEGAMTGAYFAPIDAEFHGYVRAPDGTITTFDDPAAAYGKFQGTAGIGINAWGEVVGVYFDANYALHGFIRYPNGALTNLDCPNGGTGAGQGTALNMNSPTGIQGNCIDQNNVNHGLVLLP